MRTDFYRIYVWICHLTWNTSQSWKKEIAVLTLKMNLTLCEDKSSLSALATCNHIPEEICSRSWGRYWIGMLGSQCSRDVSFELFTWHQLYGTSQKVLNCLVGLNIIFKRSFTHSFIQAFIHLMNISINCVPGNVRCVREARVIKGPHSHGVYTLVWRKQTLNYFLKLYIGSAK